MKRQKIYNIAAALTLTSLISIATHPVYADDFLVSPEEEVLNSNETLVNDVEPNTEPLVVEESNIMPLSREELLAEITQVCQDAATEEGVSTEDITDFISSCVSDNMEGLDSYEMASSAIGEIENHESAEPTLP